MIGHVSLNGKCSINLLQQNDPHHLMGKGEGRKGQLQIRPFFDRRIQPAGRTDDKGDLGRNLADP